jgi:hypothetical protein
MIVSRPPRAEIVNVLVKHHGDGYVEAFAPENVRVHFAREISASTIEGEQLADDVFHNGLPWNFRDLHRADYLRGNAFVQPLTADTARAAIDCQRAIRVLNDLAEEYGEVEGGLLWTL